MINNRDCFFYKKSDFINRLQDISPDSVSYIADTQQIYTHGRYFECNVTQDIVEQLIQNHGYLTAADLPVLTGGASPTPGEYVTGVSVGGHNINVQKGKLSEINVGTASKLETPRKIELSGDLSGSIMFDGSQDVNIETIVHNSTTADRLTTPRTISLSSQATGQVSFDGSGNVDIPVTVNELDSKNSNNQDLNSLVTLNGYGGSLFYGIGGNTSVNKPSGVDWFGLFSFKSASGNYTTQILGSKNRLYSRSNADTSLGSWNTIAYLTDITWSNLSGKPSSFTPSSHTHTISQISNLNGNWDSLLANAPSVYLTRWPSISEVTGKQNLTIRLNGGTTEGTNQFTYNGTAGKTLSITPSNIGAATSSHTHDYIISKGRATAISGTTKPGSGLSFVECYNNGYPTAYGNVLQIQGAWASGAGQLLLGWSGGDSLGRIYYRSLRDTTNSWSSWGTVAYLSDIPSLSGYATQSWVQSQGYLTSVTWDNVKNKPSWIGSSKPSYSWSEISGKPLSFTPSSHSHAWLNGWGDTRSVAETPNSYNGRFEVVGIKNSSTYGISSGTYVQVLGFRGWTDSSGGRAHELAFADNGRIYHRDGATTSWDSWDTVAYLSDIQKNTTGTSNSTSKLYLVGGPTQNSAGVITYSNSAVYTQSGQLYATQMNSTNGFFETSDARLKDFKEDIKALGTIDQIPTKYFTWKEDENQESQVGTSAQEVEKLYPELVSKTEDDTLTVDYAKLSIIALAAIKELKAEIQSLKEEIKQLKSK